jgi:hypothetical protein
MISARFGSDPAAPRIVPGNAADIWPYRQKDLLIKVNRELGGSHHLTSHDILCINWKYDILNARPEFAHKPHRLASPQYSDRYIDWIVSQARSDNAFFQKLREEHRLSP